MKILDPKSKIRRCCKLLNKAKELSTTGLTVRVSLGKQGLALTHNRDTLYWVFRPQTIFEIHQ